MTVLYLRRCLIYFSLPLLSGVRGSSSQRWLGVYQWSDCLPASGLLSAKGYHVSNPGLIISYIGNSLTCQHWLHSLVTNPALDNSVDSIYKHIHRLCLFILYYNSWVCVHQQMSFPYASYFECTNVFSCVFFWFLICTTGKILPNKLKSGFTTFLWLICLLFS